jgi:tellurite resistance protein TehA-like permease
MACFLFVIVTCVFAMKFLHFKSETFQRIEMTQAVRVALVRKVFGRFFYTVMTKKQDFGMHTV